MQLLINSPKYGSQTVEIDDEDMGRIGHRRLYIWSTSRHHTLYVRVQLPKGKSKVLHRFILGSCCEGKIIDHINGNGLDNRRSNLRIGNHTINNCNVRKRKNAKHSMFKGVCKSPNGKRWKAQIQYNKIKIALGTFDTETQAAEAYNKAAAYYHGEAAVLNSIPLGKLSE